MEKQLEPEQNPPQNTEQNHDNTQHNKSVSYFLVFILVAAAIIFRLLNEFHLEQTSLLFIGIPALLALMIIRYTGTPETAYGMAFKTVTLFLLMSAILMGEGVVCIIFAAPIFYGITALIIGLHKLFTKKGKGKQFSWIILPFIMLLGELPIAHKAPVLQSVSTQKIVDATDLDQAFSRTPNFIDNIPSFFKIGFPKPIQITNRKEEDKDVISIQFESNTKGIGQLDLQIVERSNTRIVFKPIGDNTHIHHWLHWESVVVELKPVGTEKVEVNWTSNYYCVLNPGWYFKPIEKLTIDQSNKFLIQSYFGK